MTRTQLESTMDAVRQRGVSIEYAAIPASYPLRGAFDFGPEAQRSLFEYAASCAAADRLWIPAHARGGGEHKSESRPASAPATCPADDSYIEHVAALTN